MIPQVEVEDRMYVDYTEDQPEDYSGEKWYKNLMNTYKDAKECDKY